MRRTMVVHTRLGGHMARVAAARLGKHGIQILTMGQMAGVSPAVSRADRVQSAFGMLSAKLFLKRISVS